VEQKVVGKLTPAQLTQKFLSLIIKFWVGQFGFPDSAKNSVWGYLSKVQMWR
jgi:hypothetical protein